MKCSISIIIPAYNEETSLSLLLSHLQEVSNEILEVILVDGNSVDKTIAIAKQYNVQIVNSKKKGRAAQMNEGALQASGDILYFLHADSVPKKDTYKKIITAISNGYIAGTSVVLFDSDHWTFKLSTMMSKLQTVSARFGDQGLFIKKNTFNSIEGFDTSLLLFEDQEIFKRISKKGTYTVLDTTITTSARRFKDRGVYRVHAVYYLLTILYQLGVSQKSLMKLYKAVL
jgi:rSAM/selenodomain-associated transferase 2